MKDTHKEFKVSGTDQAIASVVTWSTNHQQRRSGLLQGGEWIRLQEKKQTEIIYTALNYHNLIYVNAKPGLLVTQLDFLRRNQVEVISQRLNPNNVSHLTLVTAVAQLSPASSISWSTLKPYSLKSSSSMCWASSCLWRADGSVCTIRQSVNVLTAQFTRYKTSPEIFDGLGHAGCCSATETVLLVVVSCSGQRACPRLSEDRRSS